MGGLLPSHGYRQLAIGASQQAGDSVPIGTITAAVAEGAGLGPQQASRQDAVEPHVVEQPVLLGDQRTNLFGASHPNSAAAWTTIASQKFSCACL